GGLAAAMLGVYASAIAILLASLVLGTALLHLLGRTTPTWLSGAVGFAALTVASPLLIRLPGRATTVSILLAITVIAAILYLWRGPPVPRRRTSAASPTRHQPRAAPFGTALTYLRGRRGAWRESVRRVGTEGDPPPPHRGAAI